MSSERTWLVFLLGGLVLLGIFSLFHLYSGFEVSQSHLPPNPEIYSVQLESEDNPS